MELDFRVRQTGIRLEYLRPSVFLSLRLCQPINSWAYGLKSTEYEAQLGYTPAIKAN
jgi:hypothetical protein